MFARGVVLTEVGARRAMILGDVMVDGTCGM